MPNSGRNWQEIASSKRQSLIEAIPSEWRLKSTDVPPVDELIDVTSLIATFLNPLEQRITSANALTILENVRCSIWSAIAVTQAFCHRAALAHQLTHCISEFNLEEAYNRAAELDVVLRTTGRPVGPLHGLPISLKDRFDVEGLDSSCGYVSWIGDTKGKDDEGLLVQHLRQAGAIIFVKTNVPMSMLIGETTNNIVGSTLNPYNRALQVGGASGGEGALLALRGSPFGWGADIAGSIRIPASFNNLWGLRPSSARISSTGLADSLPGLPIANSVVGPMCADLASLTHMMQWCINRNAWEDDHKVIDLPWRDSVFKATSDRICHLDQRNGSLVFAVLATDEEVYPHPPVQRAMRIVTEALLQRGYEVTVLL
ncbi:hypothetical protein N0V94_006134 [Neodidymelliopsis sp. IMI 364377]|nr:hypothetical protein N0V94_006134 [Neodidymelliopsis sp. IMI 364377]